MLPGLGVRRLTAGVDGFEARVEGGAEPLTGELVVAAPAAPTIVSRHHTGERVAELSGQLEAAPADTGPLTLYWDRSRSRAADRLAAEAALAARLVDAAGAPVTLILFNSTGAERQLVRSGAQLTERLGRVRYAGATSYVVLNEQAEGGRCVLFTDGAATLDRGLAVRTDCRLDVVTSSSSPRRPALRALAAEGGGRLFELSIGSEAAVARALTTPAPRLPVIEDAAGRALPALALDAEPGRWRRLVAVPDGAEALWLRDGTERRLMPLPAGAPLDAPAALLSADRLARLDGAGDRAAYVEEARRFGVATPSLAYVVLEAPGDYVAG